ncbi:MAG: hypothetical protein JKY61_09275 [Planctomycetes bacterium]|nr:hypothetical protein [Planctomycetota bacterium]
MIVPTFPILAILALAAFCPPSPACSPFQETPSQGAQAKTLEAPQVTFSSQALGKVWAAVGPETVPVPLPLPAQELNLEPYGRATLAAWAQALKTVGEPLTAIDARLQAHLSLCLIAQAQGRDQDAWKHFLRLADGPGHVACALPHLWPGVPFGTPIGPGARLTLTPNTLLRPAFPMMSPDGKTDGAPGEGPLRMQWKQGLQVGDQPLELRFTLQPEGIEMDLWNRGSKTFPIRALLPSPRNYAHSYTYSDWEKVPEPEFGITVQLPPDREGAWTLFSRLKPAFEAWPRSPKPGARWFEDRSMRLILGPGESPTPALESLAKVLRDLLNMPVQFAAGPNGAPLRCVLVDLGPTGPTRDPKSAPARPGPLSDRHVRMRRLLSSVELFLLP